MRSGDLQGRVALLPCAIPLRETTNKGLSSRSPDSGESLLRQRLDLGHTQRQVAEQIGVNASTIRNWENGSNQPRLAARRGVSTTLRHLVFEFSVRPALSPSSARAG